MQCVSDVLAMKNSAGHVTVGEDRALFSKVNLFETIDQLQVRGAVRLFDPLQLTHDEWRNDCAILRQLMLPPTDRQITTKRLSVIEIRANHRRFEICARFHKPDFSWLAALFGFDASVGSNRRIP